MTTFLYKILRSIKSNSQNHKTLSKLDNLNIIDSNTIRSLLGKIYFEIIDKNISSINEVEFKVFSQFGDDGIIQYLNRILPFQDKTFIEIGVQDYTECNTKFLLTNNYWSGCLIEGDKGSHEIIIRSDVYRYYNLHAVHKFVTKQNINDTIAQIPLASAEILSIDIDGNDYHIWESISGISPIIVIIEYNALFGFENSVTTPYIENFQRGVHSQFNFYGSSLKALVELGKSKGYTLLGCNLAGNNAYFIKDEFVKYVPFDLPSIQRAFQYRSFNESFKYGSTKEVINEVFTIDGFEVLDTGSNKMTTINAQEIYTSLINNSKV